MLNSIIGHNWQNSDAHKLLLSKFLSPRNLSDFNQSDEWEIVLREKPINAIKRFQNEKMIMQAGLIEQIDYEFKLAQLKEFAKEKGISVSGKKADIVRRLIELDYDDMKKRVKKIDVYICTEKGKEIAEQFLVDEKNSRIAAEEEAIKALHDRDFERATRVVASFEAKQVFPRGLNVDWKSYDVSRDNEVLIHIFSARPKLLLSKGYPINLDDFKVPAALMHLWGTNMPRKEWFPDKFENHSSPKEDIVVRMIMFNALFLVQRSSFKKLGVKKVRIRSFVNDDLVCDNCREKDGKEFNIDKVPELPHEDCTSNVGCRCSMQPVVDLDDVEEKLSKIFR